MGTALCALPVKAKVTILARITYVCMYMYIYIYIYTYGADTNYGVAPILGIPLMKGNNTKILQ